MHKIDEKLDTGEIVFIKNFLKKIQKLQIKICLHKNLYKFYKS